MKIFGGILLGFGLGLIGFEVLHGREMAIVYIGVGFVVVSFALLGYADEIGAGLKRLLDPVREALPWNRKGE